MRPLEMRLYKVPPQRRVVVRAHSSPQLLEPSLKVAEGRGLGMVVAMGTMMAVAKDICCWSALSLPALLDSSRLV